ncbi:hypothetical protein VHEMI03409 [[Torrubiella] hemipterigena]|uniref:tetrahydrofolate synthase n=1 Tax=[Torrubiella] hemipterigena TaxID=1531966 RepID=A0A0A1TAQ5_9HYPO|nr:hypothetical protein VHEMI03409 [[Torrubiella] hemipterigena]
MVASQERAFQNAIAFLNSRMRTARPQHPGSTQLPVTSLPSTNPTFRGTPPIQGMREWLRKLGHTNDQIDSLNVIHIAGTKGKGTTCTFIENFLREHGKRTGFPRKTGLYTGPHLVDIRERIRINFAPVSKDTFSQNLAEVREALGLEEQGPGPRYLQILALTSYHTFIKEKVDVAIYETHHGGEYDATNCVENPVITGITSIGMDHIASLGPSITDIAWHKAGIIKPGAAAFTAEQKESVAQEIKARANEKNVDLEVVASDPTLPGDFPSECQRLNASLALRISNKFLNKKHPDSASILSESDIARVIENFTWPGRFQLIERDAVSWYIDGAHNELSMPQVAGWFNNNVKPVSPNARRVLIFAQKEGQRDGLEVVKALAESLVSPVEHVIFTPHSASAADIARIDTYCQCWAELRPEAKITRMVDPKEALRLGSKLASEADSADVLVTGSLYLVGEAIQYLGEA